MLTFLDRDGTERRLAVEECAGLRLEEMAPVRAFPSYQGQRNFPGLWWSSTMGGHVGYESWLERDHAVLLDFDTDVVAFAPQPFWLFFRDGLRVRRHAPDWFARMGDGSALVLDCRPDDRIKPKDEAAFAATAQACRSVGWSYQRVGAPEPVRMENVRWLAGYRHPRFANPEVAAALAATFVAPRRLWDGAAGVGRPMTVLPVVYHLLWRRTLEVDLQAPLSMESMVRTVG